MDATLFRRFREIAYEKAGIALPAGKEALLTARLARRMRALGLATAREYLTRLESDETGEELVRFLDVISTNYTRFFREPAHFDALTQMVTSWVEAGQREFKVWCAASSTGEEPYSLVITLLERFPSIAFRLLATDISTRALAHAARGAYEAGAFSEVPRHIVERYFDPVRFDDGELGFVARPELRARVGFRRLNLSTPPFPIRGPLDVVFCRNVMIYFDQPVRQRLVREIDRLLKPGGMLVVGHSETLTGIASPFVCGGASVFFKPVPGASAAPPAPKGARWAR